MQRDIRSFLWDVREAADAIMGFTQGRSFDDYVADLMFRSEVEVCPMPTGQGSP